jgi:hypothetical protein
MKILNSILFVVFILSAAVQYNDPDPLLWGIIYLYTAAICYLAIKGKYYLLLNYFGIVFCLIYAIYLFFDKDGVISWFRDHDAENIVQSMKATKPWIEETREFGGILICLFAFIFNSYWFSKKK